LALSLTASAFAKEVIKKPIQVKSQLLGGTPTIINAVPYGGISSPFNLVFSDSKGYVSQRADCAVKYFDIDDSSDVILMNSIDCPDVSWCVGLGSDYGYTAHRDPNTNYKELAWFPLSDPNPQIEGTLTLSTNYEQINSIIIDGTTGYVSGVQDKIVAFSTRESTLNPEITGVIIDVGQTGFIAIDGTVGYLTNYNGANFITCFGLTSQDNFQVLASTSASQYLGRLAFDGTVVYQTGGGDIVAVYPKYSNGAIGGY
jgi:hypothetical protein